MQKLLGYVRCALDKYKMIEEGDRIAVAVSGGKDSVALLAALGAIRRFYPINFSLTAITIDPCFNKQETDYSPIEKLCKELDIPYIIKRTELGTIIFETRKEKILAVYAQECAVDCSMTRPKKLDAIKLPLGIILTMPPKLL